MQTIRILSLFALIIAIKGEERPAVHACTELEHVVREKSPENHFPYMAAISLHSLHDMKVQNKSLRIQCAGTLIDRKFVMTGAECANRAKVVFLGIKSLSGLKADDFVEVPIKEAHIHPEFSKKNSTHDIALLELEHEVVYNKFIFPVCVHAENEVIDENLEIHSWNRRAIAKDIVRHSVKIVALPNCNSTYVSSNFRYSLSDGHICAISKENSTPLCSAISGAPLVSVVNAEKQVYREIGFVTIGSTSCDTDFPDALTRISSYVDFIENIVWPKKQVPVDG